MDTKNSESEKYTEKLDRLQHENDSLRSEVAELTAQVSWLMEQVRLSRHQRFGASSEKSEYDNIAQLNIFNESEMTADANVPEPEISEVKKYYRKKRREAKVICGYTEQHMVPVRLLCFMITALTGGQKIPRHF